MEDNKPELWELLECSRSWSFKIGEVKFSAVQMYKIIPWRFLLKISTWQFSNPGVFATEIADEY